VTFHVLTIFPEFFAGPFEHGVVARAKEAGLIRIRIHNLRDWTSDRHKTVDDRPFGGGEGMLLKPEPLFQAVESIWPDRKPGESGRRVALLSAQGGRFDQAAAERLSRASELLLICGRYEGVDERVAECLADQEISIGDYVLSGGELGAAVMIDTITRLVPGALGNAASARQESFSAVQKLDVDGPDSTCGSGGLLDYPHYTRPAEFRGMAVPEVLIGGNHEQIRKWRRGKALEKTLRNRPDLLERQPLSEEDRKFLADIGKKKIGRE
jgi:tRNA (guanine37-N1)-methyltransferase